MEKLTLSKYLASACKSSLSIPASRGTAFCFVALTLLLTGCELDDEVLPSANANPDKKPVSTDTMAISRVHADQGFSTAGEVNFYQDEAGVHISGELSGLAPGQHGFHIHEFGDCSAPDGKSAGGHFAPNNNPHGGPQDDVKQRHAGDLGNISADEDGRASIDILNAELTISEGPKAIIGKSVIVHANADDYVSQPSGDAGARVGCGTIEKAMQKY